MKFIKSHFKILMFLIKNMQPAIQWREKVEKTWYVIQTTFNFEKSKNKNSLLKNEKKNFFGGKNMGGRGNLPGGFSGHPQYHSPFKMGSFSSTVIFVFRK